MNGHLATVGRDVGRILRVLSGMLFISVAVAALWRSGSLRSPGIRLPGPLDTPQVGVSDQYYLTVALYILDVDI